ncbi:MAG: mechanosensitive ion channel [Caldilineaceae bacterium]|nr:mechanosensitive ion channel [Caldilineaceae bacterium]
MMTVSQQSLQFASWMSGGVRAHVAAQWTGVMGDMDDPRIRAITDQLNTILLVAERPVVQRQIIAFALVVAAAWFGSWLLRRLLHIEPPSEEEGESRRTLHWRDRIRMWVRAVHVTLFPLFGLICGQLAIQVFGVLGWRSGLLERFIPIFWLFLVYRVLVGLLYGFLPAVRALRYQRRFLAPIFTILVILIAGRSLSGTFPIGAIELFTFMDQPVVLGALFSAAVLLYIFLVLALVTREGLRTVILPRANADPGVTNTIVVISYYAVVTMGILTAVSTLGVDLSALAIIGGGLSVGLGFGLQELVGNFVSGILLLFERTLRPGDVIEVGGSRGVVEQLRMRATVVRSADNIEILIPNKSLLTSTVSTYKQTDRTIRRTIRVGVSYHSDPTEVREVLLGVAERHGLVLKKPAPDVFFVSFGPSSLDFELAFWLGDPISALKVTSDLHFMIWREFEKHRIEIPFPQQDIHIRSGAPWQTQQAAHQSHDTPTRDGPIRLPA